MSVCHHRCQWTPQIPAVPAPAHRTKTNKSLIGTDCQEGGKSEFSVKHYPSNFWNLLAQGTLHSTNIFSCFLSSPPPPPSWMAKQFFTDSRPNRFYRQKDFGQFPLIITRTVKSSRLEMFSVVDKIVMGPMDQALWLSFPWQHFYLPWTRG